MKSLSVLFIRQLIKIKLGGDNPGGSRPKIGFFLDLFNQKVISANAFRTAILCKNRCADSLLTQK